MLLNKHGRITENVIVITALLVLIAVGFYIITTKAQKKKEDGLGILRNASVAAAAADIPDNRPLTREDFMPVTVDKSEPGALEYGGKELFEAVGKYYAATPIKAGAQVTKYMIVSADKVPLYRKIKTNEAAYIFENLEVSAGILPGDSVEIIDELHFDIPLPAVIAEIKDNKVTVIIDKAILDYIIMADNSGKFDVRKSK